MAATTAAVRNVYIHNFHLLFPSHIHLPVAAQHSLLSCFIHPRRLPSSPVGLQHDHRRRSRFTPLAQKISSFLFQVYKRGFYRFTHSLLFAVYIFVCVSVYFIFDELSFCDKEDGQNISKAKGLPERFINKGPIFFMFIFLF